MMFPIRCACLSEAELTRSSLHLSRLGSGRKYSRKNEHLQRTSPVQPHADCAKVFGSTRGFAVRNARNHGQGDSNP